MRTILILGFTLLVLILLVVHYGPGIAAALIVYHNVTMSQELQPRCYEVTYVNETADTITCYDYYEKYEIIYFYTRPGYPRESAIFSTSVFNVKSIRKIICKDILN